MCRHHCGCCCEQCCFPCCMPWGFESGCSGLNGLWVVILVALALWFIKTNPCDRDCCEHEDCGRCC